MFKKIISRIPYSPSMIHNLGFYAGRLRKEEATRKIGLVLTALALVVQAFTAFSPPESANAADSSDLIYGGVSNGSQLMAHYDANTNNIRDLYNHLGISRAELVSATSNLQTLSSNIGSYSWGLTPHFGAAKGEGSYVVKTSQGSARTFYYRPHNLWGNFTYKAFVGQSAGVGWFAIMLNCGNLILKITPPPHKCPPGQVGTYPNCSTPPCPQNAKLAKNDPKCQPCPGDATLLISDSKCAASFTQSKTAVNLTQNNANADSTAAKSGDRITYTLSVKNGGLKEEEFIFKDYVSDVLEYADIFDAGGGTLSDNKDGSAGSNNSKILTWPAVKIKPGETQKRSFTIQIKNTLPAMASGKSNPTSYDCKIDNTFGNTISTKIECPTPKVVEKTVAELPKTGPGANMTFAGIIAAVVVYFYARSRQLSKEVKIIRHDMSAGTI